MQIEHRTEIEKLTFRPLDLRQSESLSTPLINQIFVTFSRGNAKRRNAYS